MQCQNATNSTDDLDRTSFVQPKSTLIQYSVHDMRRTGFIRQVFLTKSWAVICCRYFRIFTYFVVWFSLFRVHRRGMEAPIEAGMMFNLHQEALWRMAESENRLQNKFESLCHLVLSPASAASYADFMYVVMKSRCQQLSFKNWSVATCFQLQPFKIQAGCVQDFMQKWKLSTAKISFSSFPVLLLFFWGGGMGEGREYEMDNEESFCADTKIWVCPERYCKKKPSVVPNSKWMIGFQNSSKRITISPFCSPKFNLLTTSEERSPLEVICGGAIRPII